MSARTARERVAGSSKFQLQPELHFSRPGSRGDASESRRSHVDNHGRLIKVRPVKEVERFPTELQIETIILAETRILADPHVGLRQARTDDGVTAFRSEAERPGRP